MKAFHDTAEARPGLVRRIDEPFTSNDSPVIQKREGLPDMRTILTMPDVPDLRINRNRKRATDRSWRRQTGCGQSQR
jgi:hypothetical protein